MQGVAQGVALGVALEVAPAAEAMRLSQPAEQAASVMIEKRLGYRR